jgi:spore coat polysaccharide biosynthesis protein SpsF
MASTRLPGKVLKEINGKPMLLWQIERIKRSRLLDDVVVATTTNPLDDKIVKCCEKNNIKYFRGSEDDVLSRIASVIREFQIDVHVEFFGDSPLPDAQIIDEIVSFYLKHEDLYDYVSNAIKVTYPPGQEVIVFRGRALIELDESLPADSPAREHVSILLVNNKDKYKSYNLEAPLRYHYPETYLEVDVPQDFELISNIISHFAGLGQEYFTLAQILDYLKQNPQLVNLNNKVHRRWKEFKQA